MVYSKNASILSITRHGINYYTKAAFSCISQLNRKSAYAAAGVLIVGFLLFVLIYDGVGFRNLSFIFSKLKLPNVNINGQIFNQEALKDASSLGISIKSVQAEPVDNRTAKIRVTFNVYNPNKGTVMLESISYNVYSQSGRIVSGDIGEKPEGFVGSQANIFPIVGNTTLAIGDERTITRDGPRAADWKNIIGKSAAYTINGTFSYKQTSSFQSSGGENNFSQKFP